MFGLSGDRELKKQMEKLSKAVNNRISKKALGVGTKIVAKAIKKQIPNSQKSARKAIGSSVQRPKKRSMERLDVCQGRCWRWDEKRKASKDDSTVKV